MIEIGRDDFIVEVDNQERCRAVRHLCHECHTDLQCRTRARNELVKCSAWNLHDSVFISLAVCTSSFQCELSALTEDRTHHFFLKSRNHLPVANEERQWISPLA